MCTNSSQKEFYVRKKYLNHEHNNERVIGIEPPNYYGKMAREVKSKTKTKAERERERNVNQNCNELEK